MSDPNPYAVHTIAAAADSADARATFLQKTYTLLMLGVAVFAGTLWASANVPAVQELAIGLYRMGWLVMMLILFGVFYGVRALATKYPINLVAYFGLAFFFGLLLAPMVLSVAAVKPDVLTQAVIVTLLVFSGLTAYVFVSGKDFSFMGGALSIGVMAMIGILLAGWLFGFDLGLWFGVLGVVVYAGFVLYDTSRVLHHYPVTAHVPAAIELFTSLVMLFQYVLYLLMSLNND